MEKTGSRIFPAVADVMNMEYINIIKNNSLTTSYELSTHLRTISKRELKELCLIHKTTFPSLLNIA